MWGPAPGIEFRDYHPRNVRRSAINTGKLCPDRQRWCGGLQRTAPAAPAANRIMQYMDSADGAMKLKDSSGTVTVPVRA